MLYVLSSGLSIDKGEWMNEESKYLRRDIAGRNSCMVVKVL